MEWRTLAAGLRCWAGVDSGEGEKEALHRRALAEPSPQAPSNPSQHQDQHGGGSALQVLPREDHGACLYWVGRSCCFVYDRPVWCLLTPGAGDGQGGLGCCDSWGRQESDTAEPLNWLTVSQMALLVQNPPQCRRRGRWGVDPWVKKIPWRRAWQPISVFFFFFFFHLFLLVGG